MLYGIIIPYQLHKIDHLAMLQILKQYNSDDNTRIPIVSI